MKFKDIDISKVDENVMRRLQNAVLKAMITQIENDPGGASASLLSVAAKMLHDLQIGLIVAEAGEMSPEEEAFLEKFGETDIDMESENFTTTIQ